ncbi:hypothetical protein [Alkalihalophilus marmarensis]|uniref:Uncharacterized protein n=1 Tax=Alkalihalophilus marmarensis DSM 21297 TaxID=1188261 RepID=U6SKX6_9BACI|nr:hypothetical protein [Alkalihalophilus marmarensis]ERN52037.1 hypothetical protein A33I_18260 [Alkalihalophilus marmarensis DSM 21297]
MKILGLGVNIIERANIPPKENDFIIGEWDIVKTSVDEEVDSSIIASIKEAFLKASSDYLTSVDLPKVVVEARGHSYHISIQGSDYLDNKQCWITTGAYPEYTIASVTVVSA